MSNGLPCPNPTCTHVFPAAAIAGAAVLTCPRCATVFRFQAGATAVASGTTPSPTPRTIPPAPAPLPSVPVAEPVIPQPVAPVVPAPHGSDFGAGDVLSPAALRRRTRPSPLSRGKIALGVGVVLTSLALLIGLGLRSMRVQPEKKEKPTGSDTVFAGLNFRYVLGKRGWSHDDKMKEKLPNGRLVLQRLAPASWFAILAKDFKVRNPRPRELYAEGEFALKQQFTEFLATEYHPQAKFQGHAAQMIVFQGQVNKQMYAGECHMFAHQGIGYWVIVWTAGEGQAQEDSDFADLRERFVLGDDRKSWEEKRPAQRDFVAQNAECRLRDTEGFWEETRNKVTDYDKAADLVLHAREDNLATQGDAKRNLRFAATVMVLQLPPSANLKEAVGAARANLLARQKMDYKTTTLEAVSDKEQPLDKEVALGNVKGHLGMVRVRNTDTLHRFVVQAVIPGPTRTLVIQGDCSWKEQEVWKEPLLQLIQTLQLGAAAKAP